MDTKEVVIATAGGVSSKVTQVGAWTAFLAWAANQDPLALVGVAIGFAGFGVNWYYKAKEDRRAKAKHDKLMGG